MTCSLCREPTYLQLTCQIVGASEQSWLMSLCLLHADLVLTQLGSTVDKLVLLEGMRQTAKARWN